MLSLTVNGFTRAINNASALTRIEIYGRGGHDTITLASSVTTPGHLFGGPGIDNITGGSGNDVLHGDGGDDTLNGAGGNADGNGRFSGSHWCPYLRQDATGPSTGRTSVSSLRNSLPVRSKRTSVQVRPSSLALPSNVPSSVQSQK